MQPIAEIFSNPLSINFMIVALLINSTLACIFFILAPKRINRREVRSYQGYFVASLLALSTLILRPYMPLWLSVFLVNVLYLLSSYCVLIGLAYRFSLSTRKLYRIAIFHIAVVSFSQSLLALFIPDYFLLRLFIIYISVCGIFIYCLGIATRYRSSHPRVTRVLTLCVGFTTLSILTVPAFYFGTDSPHNFLGILLVLQNGITFLLFGAFYISITQDAISYYEDTARIDELTEVYNRRHFFDLANQFLGAAHRHNFPISLILCDLDDFRAINDECGHRIGDKVLIETAATLQDLSRQEDVIARLDGCEFAALLPQTRLDSAELLAHRLRDRIETLVFSDDECEVKVLASFAVVNIKEQQSIEAVLRVAETLLATAKSEGGNRVMTSAMSH